MVKGYTRGSGNSRKFIPTRDIHRGLSKAQISHGVEPPISAGNEMLQRKKIEIDKSKKYDVKELYKVYDREYGNTRDQVCSVCGEKQINFIEDHIREKHPELLSHSFGQRLLPWRLHKFFHLLRPSHHSPCGHQPG